MTEPPIEAAPPAALARRKNFFKAWREKAGLTQRELAKRMQVSNASVSRVENGFTPFNEKFLEGYAIAVGTTPLALQNGPEEAERQARVLALWKELQATEDELWKGLPPGFANFLRIWKALPAKQRKVVSETLATLDHPGLASLLTQLLVIWQRLELSQRRVALGILKAAFSEKKT